MNKIMHGVVLAVFALACWLVTMILRMSMMVAAGTNHQLPAFSRFCLGVGPMIAVGLTALAAIYCLVVWLRKWEKCPSWVAFLATSMSTVVLLMLPMIIAIQLPIIDFINRLPHN